LFVLGDREHTKCEEWFEQSVVARWLPRLWG
jgi:hypothetical protein